MKYTIYGKKIEAVRSDGKWHIFLLGSEGKKRPFADIFIPSSIRENQVKAYLEDMLHEWARPKV